MMELFIAPCAGIWHHSINSWDEFLAALLANDAPASHTREPAPELLPAREGRRTPLLVRMALEVGVQVCRGNNIALSGVQTVFASAVGDTDITDYMCRALATPSPMLSPTRFHNSVHNAASGYWSIGATNQQSSTAVAAHNTTLPAALLEAATLATCTVKPVLVITSDIAAPAVIEDVSTNRQAFAAGVLIGPRAENAGWRHMYVDYQDTACGWPTDGPTWLRDIEKQNDSAKIMPLLLALSSVAATELQFPLGGGQLKLALGATPNPDLTSSA